MEGRTKDRGGRDDHVALRGTLPINHSGRPRTSTKVLPCVRSGSWLVVDVKSLHSEPEFYCFLSQSAVVFGSNRTQVPMRNEGMRPAFACLKIVT